MAIITLADCMLLSCSSCGDQFLASGSSKFREAYNQIDQQQVEFVRKHTECPPRELTRPQAAPVTAFCVVCKQTIPAPQYAEHCRTCNPAGM